MDESVFEWSRAAQEKYECVLTAVLPRDDFSLIVTTVYREVLSVSQLTASLLQW